MTRTALRTDRRRGRDPSASAAVIDSFSRRYAFLSNFYPSPIVYEGICYPTAEHAFQAAKALNPDARMVVAQQRTARAAKRAGRRLPLRPGWDSARLGVMLDVLRLKFAPNSPLADQLLRTGDAELIEGNTWGDRFWGVVDGEGSNHLGRTLMQVRAELHEFFAATA